MCVCEARQKIPGTQSEEIVTPSLPHCIFEDHVAVLQFEILYIYKLTDHMMIKLGENVLQEPAVSMLLIFFW